jgi:hypothetical protein
MSPLTTPGSSLCSLNDPPCRDVVRDIAAADPFGTEMNISTAPPLVESQHPPVRISCPHGVVYYLTPTSEQIAAWAEGGIA